MDDIGSMAEMRRRAGHQEILGETVAKFEFFQHQWHPYSRFLDVDRVDLILRRRQGTTVTYREVQVKFGKLYTCTRKWELRLFSATAWRFFSEKNLQDLEAFPWLYLAYVLSSDDGFKGDMFVFRIAQFVDIVRKSDRLGNGNYRFYMSMTADEPKRWYVRRKPKFSSLNEDTVIDVTEHYRDFDCLMT